MVKIARKYGGLSNPIGNTTAILYGKGGYLDYWRRHPHAKPGQAAEAVEISGQPASFYAGPLNCLPWSKIER